MAKKKLNKKVVIVLASVGMLLLAGIGFAVIRKTGRWQRWFSNPAENEKMAEQYLKDKDYNQAQKEFGLAAYYSDSGKERSRRILRRAEVFLAWANIEDIGELDRRDAFRLRRKILEELVLTAPNNIEAKEKLCELWWHSLVGLARQPASRGRFDPALGTKYIKLAKRLIKKDDTKDDIWYQLGLVYSDKARINKREFDEKALRAFAKAAQLRGDNVSYRLAAARHHRFMSPDRIADGEKLILKAIADNPESAEMVVGYAQYLSSVVDSHPDRQADELRDEIDKQYEIVEKMSSENANTWLMSARHWRSRGKLDKCIAHMKKAIEINPLLFDAYVEMAVVLSRSGKGEQSLEMIRSALKKIDEEIKSPKSIESKNWRQKKAYELISEKLSLRLANYLLGFATDDAAVRKANHAQAAEIISKLEQITEKTKGFDGALRALIAGKIARLDKDNAEMVKQFTIAYDGFRAVGTIGELMIATRYLVGYHLGQSPGLAEGFLDRIANVPNVTMLSSYSLLRARIAIRNRQYEDASKLAEKVLKQHPEHPEALALQEQIAKQAGDIVSAARELFWSKGLRNDAISLLEREYEKTPENLAILQELLRFYSIQKNEAQARSLLIKAIEKNPENQQLKVRLELLDVKDPDERLARQLALIDGIYKDELERLLRKASIQASFGKKNLARIKYIEAGKIDPENPRVIGTIFQFALAENDWPLAEEWASKAAKSTKFVNNTGRLYSAILLMKRSSQEEDYAKAIAMLEEAARISKNAVDEDVSPAEAYYRLAACQMLLMERKRLAPDSDMTRDESDRLLENVRATFAKVLKYDPRHLAAIKGLLGIAYRQGDREKLNELIETAYKSQPLDPMFALAWLDLHESSLSKEDVVRRRYQLYRRTSGRRIPNSLGLVDNTLRLASLYERYGLYKQAQAMLISYYNSASSKADGFNRLAGFYHRRKMFSEIDKLYADLAERSDDKIAALLIYIGAISQQDLSWAMEILERQHDKYKDDPRVYMVKSNLLLSMGKPADASGAYDKYYEMLLKSKTPPTDAQEIAIKRHMIDLRIRSGQASLAEGLLGDLPDDRVEDKVWNLTALARISLSECRVLAGVDYTNKLAEVEKLYTQAVEASSRSYGAIVQRSFYYRQAGNYIKAEADLLEAEKLQPGSADINLRLADLYVEMQRFDDADTYYRKLILRYTAPMYYYRISSLLKKQKKWALLEVFLVDAMKEFPAEPRFVIELAGVHGERSKLAIAERNAAIAAGKKTLAEGKNALAEQQGKAMFEAFRRAEMLAPNSLQMILPYVAALNSSQRFEAAVSVCEKAMTKEEKYVKRLRPMLASALARLGRIEESDKLFVEAIKAGSPAGLGAIFAEIKLAYPAGKRRERLAKAEMWLTHCPVGGRSEYMHNLAIMFRALDDADDRGRMVWDEPDGVEKAIEFLKKAISLTEDLDLRAKYHSLLGPIYYHREDYKKAEDAYLQALSRRLKDLPVLNNLAYLYVDNLDEPSKALPYARRAVQFNQNNPNILDTYGWALAKAGKLKLAQEIMEKAIYKSKLPTAPLRYHLGYVYEKQRSVEAAIEQYKKAKSLTNPGDPLRVILEKAIKRVEKL